MLGKSILPQDRGQRHERQPPDSTPGPRSVHTSHIRTSDSQVEEIEAETETEVADEVVVGTGAVAGTGAAVDTPPTCQYGSVADSAAEGIHPEPPEPGHPALVQEAAREAPPGP